jgi:sugar phosphate isomerase/epimerase
MNRLKLGVDLASLQLPLRNGLQHASRIGATGVQLQATGDLSPRKLSQTGRREFRHLLATHNLDCSALVCPFRHGLDVGEGLMERIDILTQALSLSFDLGARIVIVQAGHLPEGDETPAARLLNEALLTLGRVGDRTGTMLALESGLDSGAALAAYLNRFDTGGLGVSYDPGNMLVNGFDPYESIKALRGKVSIAQARDARRAGASRSAAEVPVGHGDLDWLQLLGAFEEVEYRGWLIVKREEGNNRVADVAGGMAFLRRLIGPAA